MGDIATFNTSSIAGQKRKRDASKFYAVHTGRRPGIYNTWNECSQQVNGFAGAVYKSFSTRSDAEEFIAAKNLAIAGAIGSVKKWYGVQIGRTPGVYPTWLSAQEQITKFDGAKYKGFKTRAEAEAFVAGRYNATPTTAPQPVVNASKKAKTKGKGSKDDIAPAFVDIADYPAGEAPLPDETQDGFDKSVILDEITGTTRYRTAAEQSALKAQIAGPAKDSPVEIWTDGSTLGNGRIGAIAGVGVYFGPADKRNVSQGLSGARQTNQRAELTAILRALEVAPKDRKVIIYSDSNYSIKCLTEWFQKWRSNNWHNAAGKPVENKDLILKVIDLLEERHRINKHRLHDADPKDGGPWERGPASVKFVWVKGHAKDEGNNAADALATNGAREAKELHHYASSGVDI